VEKPPTRLLFTRDEAQRVPQYLKTFAKFITNKADLRGDRETETGSGFPFVEAAITEAANR
jgi:hypothetical protein